MPVPHGLLELATLLSSGRFYFSSSWIWGLVTLPISWVQQKLCCCVTAKARSKKPEACSVFVGCLLWEIQPPCYEKPKLAQCRPHALGQFKGTPTPSLAITNLRSDSTDLSIVEISYNWNHTICELLCQLLSLSVTFYFILFYFLYFYFLYFYFYFF